MKKFFALLVFFAVISVFSQGFAKEKPRIGVLRFTNSTTPFWWTVTSGRDLQDMLAAELVNKKAFRVLERKELDAVIKEQDLGASGRISPKTRAKVGKITGAKYLVAATVSAFEHKTSGGGGGISFKGIRIGGKGDRAYMAVDLKVIDVDTGEIVDARTVEATAKSGGLGLGLTKWGLSGDLNKYKKTPAGKAIRASVIEIADYLECSLVMGNDHSCMEEYDAKESRRREKTKGAIDLE